MLKNTLDHKLDFRRKLNKPIANLDHYAAEVFQVARNTSSMPIPLSCFYGHFSCAPNKSNFF